MKVWLRLTPEELAAEVAKSYLDDVTKVVDADPRMREFALDRARRARAVTIFTSETERAEAVGTAVRHSLEGYLSEAQRLDALGRVVARFFEHVSLADLGSYYLRQLAQADERLIMNGQWTITQTLHGADCAGCLDAAESAAIHAAVTGSVGGGFTVERVSLDGTLTVEHDASVERNKKE